MIRLVIFLAGFLLFSLGVSAHSGSGEDIPSELSTLEQRDAYVQMQDYSSSVWIPLVFFAGLGVFAFFMGAILGGVE